MLDVRFNQKIFAPGRGILAKGKRGLVESGSFEKRIDVAYDLFDFVLVKNGDADHTSQKFHVTLRYWTAFGM